jgi:hypothetical protein
MNSEEAVGRVTTLLESNPTISTAIKDLFELLIRTIFRQEKEIEELKKRIIENG